MDPDANASARVQSRTQLMLMCNRISGMQHC
jgi:hypothetical protein